MSELEDDHTYSIPAARHWHWLTSLECIPGSTGSEVRPGLHHSIMSIRVAKSERVVKRWWLREVK